MNVFNGKSGLGRLCHLALAALALPCSVLAEEVSGVELDAYRRPWIPPKPVRSREAAKPPAQSSIAGSDFDLSKLPRNPASADLRAKGALQVPLVFAPGQNSQGRGDEPLRDLLVKLSREGGPLNPQSRRAIRDFLAANPSSPAGASLTYEMAKQSRLHGDFAAQGKQLREAWELAKSWQGEAEKRFADRVLADYLEYLNRLGKKQELRALLEEIAGRELTGTAVEAVSKAKENLWFVDNRAEQNIFCGFTAANDVCVPLGFKPIFPDVHDEEEKAIFIRDGLSLYELKAHSHESDGDLRIVKRTKGAGIPVPSVIHFEFGHYSAITEEQEGKYRVKDAHLKFDGWVEEETVNEQASGYFLVSGGTKLPPGFAEVPDSEAKKVFGRHCVHARDDEGADPGLGGDDDEPPGQGDPGCEGMAGYRFGLLNPGLVLQDLPVPSAAPFGPQTNLVFTYNHRSTSIEDDPSHANVGPRWAYSFLEYIEIESVGTPPAAVRYVDRNGQYFKYSWNTGAGAYASTYANQPRLEYLGSGQGGTGFVLKYPDGFASHFFQPNATSAMRFYLTEVRDPQDNAITLSYDGQMRLASITNALGQATTISYTPETGDGVPSDTLKIRKITDPFGREAKLSYDASGRLKKIVDPIGVFSEFEYGTGDFVQKLTTPYGATTFAWGELPGINSEPGRYIEAIDPYGDKERAEANDLANFPAGGVDPNPAPTSVSVNGQSVSFLPKTDLLYYRNTYYWDKKMWKIAPGDYSKAQLTNWLAISGDKITGVAASAKSPLQGRVWFNYPGQTSSHAPGTINEPSKIVRAVENASGGLTWTMAQRFYDTATGRLVRSVDPEGREVRWNYATNGVDLLSVEFNDNGTWRALQTFSGYADHLPAQITDASGLQTAFTYNSAGQTTQMTVSRGSDSETVKFFYDEDLDGDEDATGYLLRIEATDPANASAFVTVASYTHDSAGRVRTATNADGYTVTLDYDDFNRVTLVTHPDATTEQFVYEKLDLVASKSRANLWARTFYNKLRKPVVTIDPAGRVTQFEWCKCGDLQKLIDPMGRVTHWKRDEQGRIFEKVYADGSKAAMSYQPLSGRLAWVKEPADFSSGNPTVSYRYSLGGQVTQEDYTSSSVTDTEFVYADPLGRLTSKTEALGTTTFTYMAFSGSTAGAGALAGTNGPLTSDTFQYGYDWKNRLMKTELLEDSTSNVLWSEEQEFDSLGRVKTLEDGLGNFAFSYAGNGPRLAGLTGPHDLSVAYEYYGLSATNTRALRLKKITNTVDSTDVSVFEYDYDISGRITEWKKRQGGTQANLALAYNLSSELIEATVSGTSGAVTSKRGWRYDPAINRIAEFTETQTIPAYFNTLNQLTRVGGSGKTLVEGTVNEPGTVTVNGQPAQMFAVSGTTDWLFQKEIEVTTGTNTVSIVATDESANVTTDSYAFDVAAQQSTLTFDANGNQTGDGAKTSTWDAKNQMLSVTVSGTAYGWTYDSVGRKVEEKVDSVVAKKWIWNGMRIVQERDASGNVVKNFYAGGHKTATEEFVYTFDHLGSVREAFDASGTLRAAYEYEVWGKRTKLSGNIDLDRGFTGHFEHGPSDLVMAPYRFYDPITARWLSQDPIGEAGGINLYGYVANDPVSYIDPTGEHPVILLAIAFYFATETYARAPEPGNSGPEGTPGNPLSLLGVGGVARPVLCKAAATGASKATVTTANLSEATIVVEGEVAGVAIEYAAAPLAQLAKAVSAKATEMGAKTVAVDTGIVADSALASSLAAKAASGQTFLGGTVTSVGTASAPRFTITIPLP